MESKNPLTERGRRGLRRLSGAALAAAVVTALTMTVTPAGAEPDAAAGAATGTPYNPLATYTGFNVVSLGDLHITAESEGPVAVGGKFSFTGSQTIVKQTGAPAALVVKGGVDWTKSTGDHQVNLGEGNVTGQPLSVEMSGTTARDTDENGKSQNLRLVKDGAPYGSEPRISLNAGGYQAADTGYDAAQYDSLFDRSSAEAVSEGLADAGDKVCAAGDVIKKAEGQNNLAEGTELPAYLMQGNSAWIWLKKGQQNILNLTADELADIREFNFRDGVLPSADTPLFINVTGAEVTLNLHEGDGSTAPYTLWNFPDATTVRQEGDSLDGSVLAPKAHLQKEKANIEGNIIVASGDMGGTEQHYLPFAGKFTPCEDDGQAVDPTISTSAEVTEGQVEGSQKTVSAKGGTITDTVTFAGLRPETEYTMSGELAAQDGTPTGIRQAVTFTTAAAKEGKSTVEGSVALTYTVNAEQAQKYAGQSLVVTEQLALGAEVVAKHTDLNDKAQTFVIADEPTVPTKPTEPSTTEPTTTEPSTTEPSATEPSTTEPTTTEPITTEPSTTEPTTTEPTTTEPSTTEPTTTEPTTTEPSTTEPTTTEPSTTEPSTTEPTTTEPTEPGTTEPSTTEPMEPSTTEPTTTEPSTTEPTEPSTTEPTEPGTPDEPTTGIELVKKVTGDRAADVESDPHAAFEVQLSWKGSDGIESFKKVTVTPGEPVDISDLPHGVEITLTETNASSSANGVLWSDIVWSGEGVKDESGHSRQGTVTLDENKVAKVTLDNVTADRDCQIVIPVIPLLPENPTTPVTPVNPDSPQAENVTYPVVNPGDGASSGGSGSTGGSSLANTGASVMGLGALAVILVGGGAWLVMRSRREV
ncbi:hypothetical protein Csp1_20680 [Corynebacterium provencense]|uniref:Uncharacterized protein n=1 Tax=Corynebacterium provencense TaxID=1737425 RepID=A0A2Z3YUF0_9CORY|nr:collagen-binding domain-containing protein [Corynebacterium provencense]AWT26830.1 hypothetical protein Csp1_20680 [Corynebacterium provencense]